MKMMRICGDLAWICVLEIQLGFEIGDELHRVHLWILEIIWRLILIEKRENVYCVFCDFC